MSLVGFSGISFMFLVAQLQWCRNYSNWDKLPIDTLRIRAKLRQHSCRCNDAATGAVLFVVSGSLRSRMPDASPSRQPWDLNYFQIMRCDTAGFRRRCWRFCRHFEASYVFWDLGVLSFVHVARISLCPPPQKHKVVSVCNVIHSDDWMVSVCNVIHSGDWMVSVCNVIHNDDWMVSVCNVIHNSNWMVSVCNVIHNDDWMVC